jgi:hypothetical protein
MKVCGEFVSTQGSLDHSVTAIQAISDIVKAPDFDRRMLQLATQLSHESDMKKLLLTVLDALLKTITIGDKGETVVDGMTLIRCIIRLILRLLTEPDANQYSIFPFPFVMPLIRARLHFQKRTYRYANPTFRHR